MKHLFAISAISFGLILCIFSFNIANASITSNFSSRLTTKAFGSKVLVTPIPGLVCLGIGQPLLLSSNIGGAIDAAKGAVSSNGAGGKALSILSGVYNMIPTYTTDPTKRAHTTGYILGREKLVPNFNLCKIGDIPIPVLKTTIYGVSK